jgi:hypothetical protein
MPRKLWGGAATADARHARAIYALRDPRDNLIYYVGMSIDAQKRLVEHLHGQGGSWKQRSWRKELRIIWVTLPRLPNRRVDLDTFLEERTINPDEPERD